MIDEPTAVDVDLFAGPGGWDVAAATLGRRTVGIEWDAAACATRAAAGHLTIRASVAEYPPCALARYRRIGGVIASPPCPAFSAAGKKAGRVHVPALVAAAHNGDWAARPDPDPLVWLSLEPGRWIEALDPEWVAMEQAPAVLPLWEAYAHWLRARGYSAWAGILSAERYGVPQVRKRAVLMASRTRAVAAPEPTHRGYDSRAKGPLADDLFGLPSFVTMADALGWGATRRPYPTVACSSDTGGPDKEKVGGSGARAGLYAEQEIDGGWSYDAPIHVNTGRDWKPGGTRRDAQTIDARSQPAPTIDTRGRWHVDPDSWAFDRPSTTIVGSFSPDVVAAPGYRKPGDPPRQNTPGSIRITLEDATVLQSFPTAYPWRGSKTKQWQQVGNAVPPGLARAILAAVT